MFRYGVYKALIALLVLGCLTALPPEAAALEKTYTVPPGKIVEYINRQPGKRLVLIYASWCPYCRQIMPAVMDLARVRKSSVIAISIDRDRDSLIEYLNNFDDVPFHALIAKETSKGELVRNLNAIGIQPGKGIPFIAVLDEKGAVAAQGNIGAEDAVAYVLKQ